MEKTDSTNRIPNWLVGAKVRPPRTGIQEVLRQSSTPSSHAALLTYIEAPAGYGKTTLLAQHRQQKLANEDMRVAWFTISADDTYLTFVEYLAFSFANNGLDIPATFFDGLLDSSDPAHFLNVLIAAIERDANEWQLILDDLENAGDDICRAIEQMLSICPENITFLMAGRKNPGIGLSIYKLQGQLSEHTPDTLCFSKIEIHSLVGDRISIEDAEKIHNTTLGWPIAVQMVNMDIKAGKTVDTALSRLRYPSETASLYIKEQIDQRLSPAIRNMLLDASILEWLEPEALNFVVGAHNILTHMDELGEVSSLISNMEGNHETYRLHPLLREFLQSALHREAPERYKEIQRKTSVWMCQQNHLRLALTHAQCAEDSNLIGETIEHFGAMQIFVREGVSRAFDAEHFLTDEILINFPRVALLQCGIHSKKGRLAEAINLYQKLGPITSDYQCDREGGNTAAFLLEDALCKPFIAHYCCQPLDKLDCDEPNRLSEKDSTSPLVAGALNNILCMTWFVKGDLPNANNAGIKARRYYETASSNYGIMFIDLHEGSIALNRGDIAKANELYSAAKSKQRQYFKNDTGAHLVVDILMAELATSQGDLANADKFFYGLSKRLIASEAWFDIYGIAVEQILDYMLYRSKISVALAFIEDMITYAEAEQLLALQPILSRQKLLLQSLSTDEPLAVHYPDSKESILNTLHQNLWRETELQTLTLYRIYARQPEKIPELSGLANSVAAYFQSKGLRVPTIRILVTAAVSQWVCGNHEIAADHLKQAMPLIMDSGFLWPCIMHADTLDAILDHIETMEPTAPVTEWKTFLSKQEDTSVKGPLFSPREVDVLKHLVQGKQDKVIARELGVTEHAVRYHLKNIYAKAQVSNRYEAITTIQASGILSNR
ncbi:helix-turn-helix transcriptional regulator [Kordiimonas pumila]|uniref:LuxR C-terminal-related transcriptional regulator n=1 Tax=Kordiimonas pumila TaxID=2161677 RepID=A0ABV7D5G6_9PROT|nr:LuxR C-terminal-related transcriptional regulator [Kordiimonas pumila]